MTKTGSSMQMIWTLRRMMRIRFKFVLALFLGIISSRDLESQDIRFNEVLPSNRFILMDEDGDYPDWFEIKNTGSQPLSLSGFSVSDSKNQNLKWHFPDYTLPAGKFLVIFASGKDRPTPPLFNHTIIRQGDLWKYLIPSAEIPGWTSIAFNDELWPEGPSGFGYGDNDDATLLPAATLSVFLRKSFSIEDTALVMGMKLHVDYDDGFVAYLNGTEIARSNLGTAGTIPAFNQTATSYVEPVIFLGGIPEAFEILNFKGLIKPGKNVLSLQVHNNSTGSSDLTAIPFLTVSLPEPAQEPPPGFIPAINGGFHTNFKIDADGDSLYLFNSSGIKIDEFISKPCPPDISLGYKPNDYSKIYGFANPTPWAENSGEALIYESAGPLVFNPPGGFFASPVSLDILSTDPDDSIYFTTDGTEPTSQDNLYTGPIFIDKPTSVRAKYVRTGKIPGETFTQSYLIGSEKNLPFLFISTDPDNLFNSETGIYVKGPNAQSAYPYFGANFWQDWERPAHIDYFDIEGDVYFNVDAGIKIYGAWSRGNDQKSLAIYARNIYGDKAINAKLFTNSDLDRFESLVLRNSGNDWFGASSQSGVFFRDLFMTSVGRDIGVDAQAGRPVIVYINGQYWGIHNLREKINEHFIADNNARDPDEINILESNANIVEGTNLHYLEMLDYIKSHDIKQEGSYRLISGMMDIDEYIRYYLLQIYYFNGDWPGNNIKYWKGSDVTDKWRWILFDTDFGFGIWDFNKVYNKTLDFATTTSGPDWPNPPWSTILFRTLLQNQTFRNRFINTFADHLNTTLLPDSLVNRINRHASDIESEIPAHIQRWGGYYSNWTRNVSEMRQFANIRPYQMQLDILQFFNISNLRKLNLSTIGCENASIMVNTIVIKNFPWSGQYFDHIPIELTAIPPDGYRFVRWEGSVLADTAHIVSDMESDKTFRAVFEPVTQPASTGIVINEIFYRGSPEINSEDWIELHNLNQEYADISGWQLSDNSNNKNFIFPEPTIMPPGGYLVICRNKPAFHLSYPSVENYTGELAFGFSNDGDCIRLYNHSGELTDSLCYGFDYPWPSEPNGLGFSLALKDPLSDNSLAMSWFSSKTIGGTPGSANLLTGIEEVFVLNDLLAYPNPFTSGLKVSYCIGTPGLTQIFLTDIHGRKISMLVNEVKTSGRYSIEYPSNMLEPGIYILKMLHPEGIITQKILKIQ